MIKWGNRHITVSVRKILEQIPDRVTERGLVVVDSSSMVMLAMWSLLLWERKLGLIVLEQLGVDIYELARALDRLLDEKKAENPVAFTQQGPILVKTGKPYQNWNYKALLEPLLQQAEHEALALSHNYVGSEHLVLAIIHLADPLLTALFQKHSIVHDRVKAILELLYS